MERIKNLEMYQKIILILLVVLLLVFTIWYCVLSAQEGIMYKGSYFRCSQEGDTILYSGKIDGEEAVFRITPDKFVYFAVSDRSYGPYSVREDATAVPQAYKTSQYMTGIEVRNGEDVIFRGVAHKTGSDNTGYVLIDENGDLAGLNFQITTGSGTAIDSEGNAIGLLKPSVGTILRLLDDPQLVKRCQWIGWFLGVFCSIAVAVSILFSDELFRWNLSFHIRDVEDAKPSDWELSRRFFGWVSLIVIAFVSYIVGLK